MRRVAAVARLMTLLLLVLLLMLMFEGVPVASRLERLSAYPGFVSFTMLYARLQFAVSIERDTFERAMAVRRAPLCDVLAIVFTNWPNSEKETKFDLIECCRETCRSIVQLLGLSLATVPLATFWVQITKFQVKLTGLSGDDINMYGIGATKEPPAPLRDFRKLLPCRSPEMMTLGLETTLETLPSLRFADPELVDEVHDICKTLLESISGK